MKTSIDNLEWLGNWYQEQCDGEWEHNRGVRLETLDPRGWELTIHLTGTSAENAEPQRLSFDSTAGEWIACSISPEQFRGAGDPRRLEQIIGIFRKWVDEAEDCEPPVEPRVRLQIL